MAHVLLSGFLGSLDLSRYVSPFRPVTLDARNHRNTGTVGWCGHAIMGHQQSPTHTAVTAAFQPAAGMLAATGTARLKASRLRAVPSTIQPHVTSDHTRPDRTRPNQIRSDHALPWPW
jgi:hypothetical protein